MQTSRDEDLSRALLLASPQMNGSPDATLNTRTPTVGQKELLPAAQLSEEDEASLQIIEASIFQVNLHRQLASVYEPLELWYLRSSIEKAHNLDEPDFASKPYLSSSLDDTFFILKKVLHRLVATSSLQTHRRMCTEIKTIMERDFSDVMRRRMDAVWSAITSSAQATRQKEESQARQNFVVSVRGDCQSVLVLSDLDRCTPMIWTRLRST